MLPEALAGLPSSDFGEVAPGKDWLMSSEQTPAPGAAGAGHPGCILKISYWSCRNWEGEELRRPQGGLNHLPYLL